MLFDEARTDDLRSERRRVSEERSERGVAGRVERALCRQAEREHVDQQRVLLCRLACAALRLQLAKQLAQCSQRSVACRIILAQHRLKRHQQLTCAISRNRFAIFLCKNE